MLCQGGGGAGSTYQVDPRAVVQSVWCFNVLKVTSFRTVGLLVSNVTQPAPLHHGRRLLHRDLKPANVFVAKHDIMKLAGTTADSIPFFLVTTRVVCVWKKLFNSRNVSFGRGGRGCYKKNKKNKKGIIFRPVPRSWATSASRASSAPEPRWRRLSLARRTTSLPKCAR